jgi:hypothetical protein
MSTTRPKFVVGLFIRMQLRGDLQDAWIMFMHGYEKLMTSHGVDNVQFKGFVTNNAQANFNAMAKEFSIGNHYDAMVGKE